MQFILGFKIVGLISFLLGGILIAVCGISLHQFIQSNVIVENSKLNISTITTTTTEDSSNFKNDKIESKLIRTKEFDDDLETTPQTKPLLLETDTKVDVLTDSFYELKKKWNDIKPFLLGSTGVAFGCGIIQILVSLFILISGSKDIRGRSKCWTCTHMILCGLLIASLLISTTYNLKNDSINNLNGLVKKIGSSIKSKKEFDKFTISWVEIYSGIIALDIVVIVILIISTCCLMRNAEYDYRAT